ncbi:MAG: hypothetical protein V3W41_02340, partial [Planctomycetota bacterium]
MMKFGLINLALVLAVTLSVAGLASAQFDVNGPNANLTLQGNVPSAVDPVNHDVTVLVPGNMVLSITT